MSPESREYITQDDQTDLAWHAFQHLFGSTDRQAWRIWLAPRRYRLPQLAVAAPEHELTTFKTLGEEREMRIEPLFTALWNSLRHPPSAPWVIHREGERCLIARHESGYLREVHWRPVDGESALTNLPGDGNRLDLDSIALPTHLLERAIPDLTEQALFHPCLVGLS